jgi:NAD(P)-dependent dehydrogenase (short-subunit alcohol dehydrogenase family)
MSDQELAGRAAIVTGASRGIGEAIARRFAAAGAAVAVTARTERETDARFPGTIHATVEAVERAGGRAIAVPADLSKAADRVRLVETAARALGPIEILVNNAAVTYFAPVSDFEGSRYDLMFEVQVKAPFELARLVLPGMRERGRGWILNVSSGAAVHPKGPPYAARATRGGTVYGMCKAALERFTTGLAAECHAFGVAVNALSPARVVATPGVRHHRLIPEGATGVDEPIEVMAEAALALCSGDPGTLTGRIAWSQPLLDELGRKPKPLA